MLELSQFHGTTQYFNVMNVNVTDGVKYLMDNGYSWLVTDFIVVAKMKRVLKNEEFLSVKLKLDGSKGQMIVTDGNGKKLYVQNYEYTDAKEEVKMFFTNNVLMFTSEY